MKNFAKYMEGLQKEWRKKNATSNESGVQNGYRRQWILPKRLWKEGLWAGIRNSLLKYLDDKGVQEHIGVHNLKSSWVQCANLYFPFRATTESRLLFASFLNHCLPVEVKSLEAIELEYAECGQLSPSRLLGEEGTRGANQTSPDLGLLINGRQGLILVENKLTEHNFYPCSARRRKGSARRPGNPNPNRCENALSVVKNPTTKCHQAAWGRKYWNQLAPVADEHVFASLPHCPASRNGYQLFRQHALAEGIAQSGKYDTVISAVAVDERNETLDGSLKGSGIDELRDWGRLFKGRAGFAVFTHQEWVSWVRDHDTVGKWSDWLKYVSGRYGLSG